MKEALKLGLLRTFTHTSKPEEQEKSTAYPANTASAYALRPFSNTPQAGLSQGYKNDTMPEHTGNSGAKKCVSLRNPPSLVSGWQAHPLTWYCRKLSTNPVW
jgi:hypothetical protein